MRRFTVVIPALNEADRVAGAIASAFAAGALEVLVADGGSADSTRDVAAGAGALVVEGETVRARQMNAAAAKARGDALLFLHADSRLPPDALRRAGEALDAGILLGGFRLRFDAGSLSLRAAALMINLRSSFLREPWGDQAQFLARAAFDAAGGYRDLPIMEDYELARRMKRTGRTIVLPGPEVTTSARRFLRRGVLATAWTNWRIIAAYHRGADPASLARLYRGG